MNEKFFIEINGSKQCMFLQSENTENPVLLYIHGGPGAPEIAFAEKYPTGLEKLFTVCWWEQRGSGISYNRKITPKEMTLEQMVSDTIEVTNYLRNRFGKEKIYIMGHSWGSLLGAITVKQQPEFFHAYIGIGQVVQQDRSERLAYTYMLEQFEKSNDKKMIRRLREFPIEAGGDISIKYLAGARSEGMNKLGIGVMRSMASMFDFVAIVLRYKGYTLSEKIKFAKGSSFSLKYLCDCMIKTDLTEQVPCLQVPVYIFQGRHDYQASYVVAKDFATALKAPIKGFYTFENSAHSPCFEEPEKMCNILRVDVLQNQVSLSDKI
ncbi:alpha/beta fold hydrolase [Caproicibacter fermentans]|uniref:Alpha/beta hydrolase n=3 Tax=Caproicibacter fermentans TaxID=2576756 RepID=A0A7G8T6N9_9FIRM|nr:alpha/beta hydrolase [Caproicibacter fermentans]QNK39280.1 alpha/beta hydrolase [Caproicibacter fermentans]